MSVTKTRVPYGVLKWVGSIGCLSVAAVAFSDFSLMNSANVTIGLRDVASYLIAFFIVLTPTVYMWRRDRSWPRGYCQVCGYDLTGNVSGTCPECGTPVRIRDQPDLPFTSLYHCRKCGCDLTDRFTGICPECGASTEKFPPGHCPMCGYDLTCSTNEQYDPFARGGKFFCIMCKRRHPQRYPPGCCQRCGFNIAVSEYDSCPECGDAVGGPPN